MSDNIQAAISAASDAEFADFKSAIVDALSNKVADRLEIEKMQLAGSLFDDEEENEDYDEPQDSQEFTTDQEENVDEDL